MAKKTRILDVVYNASNNELVRTKTLVKSAVVQVDATPFRQYYEQHYGQEIGKKKKGAAAKKDEGEVRSRENEHVRVSSGRVGLRVVGLVGLPPYILPTDRPTKRPANNRSSTQSQHTQPNPQPADEEVVARAAQAGEAQGRH